MLKPILIAAALLGVMPAHGQTSATVVVWGDSEWINMDPSRIPDDNMDIGKRASGIGWGGGGNEGGGVGVTPPPPPSEPKDIYRTHDWKISLTPGGITLGTYNGTTTALWKFDESKKEVTEPALGWSGTSNGIGVSCDGKIRGAGARWTGEWVAKLSTAILWNQKNLSIIYTLGASLSSVETAVL